MRFWERYQVVTWWHWTEWAFGAARWYGGMAYVYAWSVQVGPIEVRRILTPEERRALMRAEVDQ